MIPAGVGVVAPADQHAHRVRQTGRRGVGDLEVGAGEAIGGPVGEPLREVVVRLARRVDSEPIRPQEDLVRGPGTGNAHQQQRRVQRHRTHRAEIDELRGMVAARGITIVLDPAARAWLAAKGFDRAFGARPMARLIERVIKKPLSELLLFGSLADGGMLRVAVEEGELRLRPVGADAGPTGA